MGLCKVRGKRWCSIRYDFTRCISEEGRCLRGFMTPPNRLLVHKTKRNLLGSQSFTLDLADDSFQGAPLVLLRQNMARRVCRRGDIGEYQFVDSRIEVPRGWGPGEKWGLVDWRSVDDLLLHLCRESPEKLFSGVNPRRSKNH